MKFGRIALALLLTVILLYVARTNSRGRPEHYVHSENGFTFDMTSVPKAYEGDTTRITVSVSGPVEDRFRVQLRRAKFGQDETTPLERYATIILKADDSTTGRYSHVLMAGRKGDRLRYYFEVRDGIGGRRAMFLPGPGETFVLKYIGHTPLWIVAIHIVLMFAAVFFVVRGSLEGWDLMNGKPEVHPMARMYFWGMVCTFLGGYPFGWAMNWYTFGTVWEGVPFGTDATDNKTQLLFAYLLLVVFSALGSLTRGRLGRDIFRARTLGLLGVVGFAVMLGIYLIPHSIQFSPTATKVVCWSVIGLLALVYLTGAIRARRPVPKPRHKTKKARAVR